jgi:hypothetical protein
MRKEFSTQENLSIIIFKVKELNKDQIILMKVNIIMDLKLLVNLLGVLMIKCLVFMKEDSLINYLMDKVN